MSRDRASVPSVGVGGPNRTTTPIGPGACAAAQAYLRRQTRYRSTHDLPGDSPLYLLATGLVVTPQSRTDEGWQCRVLNDVSERSIVVSDIDVETGLAVRDLADPLAGVDDGRFLTLWQARVRGRWPGPLAHQAARIIAEDLPRPAPRLVDLDPAAIRNLLLGLHLLRRPGLRQLVTKLASSGLLACVQSGDQDHWGRYRLSLPAIPSAAPSADGAR
jgi:hypothetical protein